MSTPPSSYSLICHGAARYIVDAGFVYRDEDAEQVHLSSFQMPMLTTLKCPPTLTSYDDRAYADSTQEFNAWRDTWLPDVEDDIPASGTTDYMADKDIWFTSEGDAQYARWWLQYFNYSDLMRTGHNYYDIGLGCDPHCAYGFSGYFKLIDETTHPTNGGLIPTVAHYWHCHPVMPDGSDIPQRTFFAPDMNTCFRICLGLPSLYMLEDDFISGEAIRDYPYLVVPQADSWSSRRPIYRGMASIYDFGRLSAINIQ